LDLIYVYIYASSSITRLLLEEYGKHLVRLGRTIFKTMAMELNLDPGESETHLGESTGFVRVYRYPLRSMANSAWGIDVHTDSSVLTILNQYEVGGLEVLKDNQWLQVKPIPDELIVNLGDMMQVL
jgi:isopenicillin N synthase-like dioxygenase